MYGSVAPVWVSALVAIGFSQPVRSQQSRHDGLVPIFEKRQGTERTVCAIGDGFQASFQDGYAFYPRGEPGGHAWRFRLASASIGDTPIAMTTQTAMREPFRYSYDHGAIVEHYDLRHGGIEQRFTLAEHPGGDGDLVVHGRVDTELQAAPVTPRHGPLDFFDDRGRRIMRYGSAYAFDAVGRRTDVATGWKQGKLTLHVAAEWLRDATWPVIIDPLTSPTEVMRLPGTAGASRICIARESRSRNHNVMIYVRWSEFGVPIGKHHEFAVLCNDDFSQAVSVVSEEVSHGQSGRSLLAPIEGARRWALVRADGVYLHEFGNLQLHSGNFVPGLETGPLYGVVAGCRTGTKALFLRREVSQHPIGLRAWTFDASTGVVEKSRLVAAGLVSEPAVTVTRDGPGSSWILAWRGEGAHLDARRMRVDSMTPATRLVASSDFPAPIIAGSDGIYGILHRDPQLKIVFQPFVWTETQSTPTVGRFHRVLADDGSPRALAFDRNSKAHWLASLWVSSQPQPKLALLSGLTVLDTVSEDAGALAFEPSKGCFLAAGFGQDRKGIFAYGRTYCPGSNTEDYGISCGGFIDGPWPPLPGFGNYPVHLRNAPSGQPAVLVLGSRAAHMDMSFFGLTGCWLHVDRTFASIATKTDKDGNAQGRFSIPIWQRGDIFAQWMFVNPQAKGPIPVATTGGLRLRIR